MSWLNVQKTIYRPHSWRIWIGKKRILSALGIWRGIDRYEAIQSRQMAIRQSHLQPWKGDNPNITIRSNVVSGIRRKCSGLLFYRGHNSTK
ncbi:uncharacterized protein LY79DRAFT_590406 [Colletotrichum navitas]|uniref:Uncharacterized protein n=1 Tax=Colletotrichum navitas TaxID=681940 RepID=A0AAD8PYN9_9PEZI|nr:uncharacterized protein LY79DRAFT_590406 [Colletotrichum navitas]KAK1590450.1 hypothetical protein LY79DRAFT_590406 [Colletotrichum navitas]